jgi:broad specificity phosphatase PhoE
MALIYLIRHGRAAAGFTDNIDPGLDDLGKTQADDAASVLQEHLPLSLVSSPLLRAQETASPLAERTQQQVTIENRIAEIPSPGLSLAQRGPWLSEVMAGRWSEQSEDLQSWRTKLLQCLLEQEANTAMFSHFVAINAALGLATEIDEIFLFRPDNGSITILDNAGGKLNLVTRGDEAATKVN